MPPPWLLDRVQLSPLKVDGLTAWYDASKLYLPAGVGIASWPDLSGNGNTLAQAVGGNQPTLAPASLNGLDTAAFLAAGPQFITGTFTFTSPCTILLVARVTNAAAIAFVCDSVTSNNRQFLPLDAHQIQFYCGTALDAAGLTDLTQYGVLSCVYNAASSVMGQNGVEQSGNTGNLASSGLTLGARGDGVAFPLTGNIAEVLCYSRALNRLERDYLTKYLGRKWGITVTLL